MASRPIQPAPGRYTSAQACRSVKSLSVPEGPSSAATSGFELDQVSGYEARGQPETSQHLHQQPCRVAAGAAPARQRLLAGLHARLHANDVGNVPVQAHVQPDQEIDRGCGPAIDAGDPVLEQRAGWLELQVGFEFLGYARFVSERELLGLWLEEEIERIEHRHLGDEVHLQPELARSFRHHDSSEVVAERILLPVEEMRSRLDAQRVAEDARPGMRCRAQANHLRTQRRRPRVAVGGLVGQRYVYGHLLDHPATMGRDPPRRVRRAPARRWCMLSHGRQRAGNARWRTRAAIV